jgi:hypothetical protein
MYGTHAYTCFYVLAFQGMDSSLLQSKFHLDNDSNYVTFCRKIFQWVTKDEDVRPFHNGAKISLLCRNERILIEHGSRMIWTESLMFLANEVTVSHISFDIKLAGEIRLGFR